MSENSNASGGIGVTGLLGILFIALKLTHVIAWSWWWVLSPFWGPLAIVAAIVVAWLAFATIRDLYRWRIRRARQ